MSGISKLSSFMASVATQVRAAIHVGIPTDDEAGLRRADTCELTLSSLNAQVWDDVPGRMTRNGLGSLEIGAGKTMVNE
jgi:hypothetical protein